MALNASIISRPGDLPAYSDFAVTVQDTGPSPANIRLVSNQLTDKTFGVGDKVVIQNQPDFNGTYEIIEVVSSAVFVLDGTVSITTQNLSFPVGDVIITPRVKWVTAGNKRPLEYKFSTPRFPDSSQSSVTDYAVSNTLDENGLTQFTLLGGYSDNYSVGEYVQVTGSPDYNGIHRIVDTPTSTSIVLDFPYVSAEDTGVVRKYFHNYELKIRVYAGINTDHQDTALDPIGLIGEFAVVPFIEDGDNVAIADVSQFVKTKLSSVTQEKNINLWTDFYIEFAENYEGIGGDSFTSDDDNVRHAVYAALQDSNLMNSYVVDSERYTPSVKPILLPKKYYRFDVDSQEVFFVFGDDSESKIFENDVDTGGTVGATAYADRGIGSIKLSDSAESFFLEVIENGLQTESVEVENIEYCSRDSDVTLRWINKLGGWEYWVFASYQQHGYEVEEFDDYEPDRYIEDDWYEVLNIDVRPKIRLRAENLTKEQVNALSKIRFSQRVERITDSGNIVVNVSKGSFFYRDDADDLVDFSLEITEKPFEVQTL